MAVTGDIAFETPEQLACTGLATTTMPLEAQPKTANNVDGSYT